mgnify:CR=1 FL=1
MRLFIFVSFAKATESSVEEEEESMYEIPQLRQTVSDCGYEKALEVSVMSKSTSSDEQVIVTGTANELSPYIC